MKDVISVDSKMVRNILSSAFMCGVETVKFPIYKEEMQHRIKGFQATKSCYELERTLHSLLISKLPDTPENKAVLDEMFGVGDE